ncbi:MAG: metallophosphoesterase [Verrucomicrobiae bacterium]|nr:metallophosphoesterase [Verrucomicrobiae bacterium]
MPVTLPQLSRREFLKRAALAGAVTALAPSSYAGLFGKSRDHHTFFFLSDTHIAGNPAEIYLNVNMTDHFTACARELAAWPVKPAAVIVNGDLAYLAGKPEDYAQFALLIEPVRALAPVHLSLGNHDERENFWSAFPHDAKKVKAVPEKQATVFSSDRANWFMVDSLGITSKTPGILGPAQLDWLTHQLDARPGKPAIVVVHHNPQFPVPTTGLLDTSALMEVLASRRQVKALVFGHTHDWHIVQHESGIHLINLPPTSYPFKDGQPSGWVRCTLAKDSMELELRSLDVKHPKHAQVQTLPWRAA